MAAKRILVVDDDPNISEVDCTALEKTAVLRPDLVVLDLMHPKIDGLEVCPSSFSPPKEWEPAR